MGITWWDVAQIAVPVAASVVGGPVGGIAAGALMSGAGAAAEGDSTKEILMKTALGAGTGAAGKYLRTMLLYRTCTEKTSI